MGKCIKEKYICALSGIARSKGSDTSKNHYRLSSSICTESDRFNTRFHSDNRLPRRSHSITIRHLVVNSTYSSGGVAGMSGIGGRTNIRTSTQSSSCACNCLHLVFGNSWFRAVAVPAHWRYKKHLTRQMLSGGKADLTPVKCKNPDLTGQAG